MTFKLLFYSSSGQEIIQVSKHKYEDFLSSKNIFMEFLFLEEKFDLLMENYFEYELEILESSLRYLVFSDNFYNQSHNTRLSITRRIANLLTTCRLYLDQSTHHIHNAVGKKTSIKEEHESAKSNEYDSNLSYKVLEELRNHTQHKGYPFHIITFSTKLVEPKLGSPVKTSIIPKLSVDKLQEEGGFKQEILNELKELQEDEIDLRPHIRSYIDSLQIIQGKLRKNTEQLVSTSINKLKSVSDLLSSENKDIDTDKIWLLNFINPNNKGGDLGEYFAYKSIDRYEEFIQKNKAQKSLSSRFVTSQIELTTD